VRGHFEGCAYDIWGSILVHEVIHGSAFDAHGSVESVSPLYLNPPYDFERGQDHHGRMEKVLLEQFYRWLKPGGVLVFVLPGQLLCTCDRRLATHFRDKRVYRLRAPIPPNTVRWWSSAYAAPAGSVIACVTRLILHSAQARPPG